jgi:hypothetical protein
MLTLAIIDLMVCTIVIPGVIAREWRAVFYSDVLCKGLEFMRSLMIPSSALILVAIALDRFFLICISTKEIMTTFVAKIVILVIIFHVYFAFREKFYSYGSSIGLIVE